ALSFQATLKGHPRLQLSRDHEATEMKTLISTTFIMSVTSMSTHSQEVQKYVPPRESTKLLHSLPSKVQKAIEETRARCKEVEATFTVGDQGLMTFTLDGKQAVLIDPPLLCGGCSAGLTCSNRGTRTVEIYVLQGKTWIKALSEDNFTGDIFISYKPRGETRFGYGELNALVGDLYRGNKDCPTVEAPDASSQSYEARTCVVRWKNGKFSYKPL